MTESDWIWTVALGFFVVESVYRNVFGLERERRRGYTHGFCDGYEAAIKGGKIDDKGFWKSH